MKRTNKKGFTIVELVIVIAVIAILAAVLIPTISNVVKKAEESAYLQDRTNKQTEGVIEKIDNPNYMTWEDFEEKFAEALQQANSGAAEEIKVAVADAIKTAGFDEHGLTEDQIRKIVEKSLEGQLTDAQVKAIVEQAVDGKSLTEDTVKQIVNKAVSGLKKNVGVTKDEMKTAISAAIQSVSTGLSASEVEAAINSALEKFDRNGISDNQVDEIVAKVLAQLDINAENNAKITEVVAKSTSRQLPESDNLKNVPVVYLGTNVDLDVTYEFSTGYDVDEEYNTIPKLNIPDDFWLADYEVSFNKDILPDSVVLGGYYRIYGSLGFPVCDPSAGNIYSTLHAGTKVRLLQTVLKDFNAVFTYNDIVEQVGTFLCGVCVTDPGKVQKGTTITVELCLYQCKLADDETDGSFVYDGNYYVETGKRVVCETINYDLNYAEPVSNVSE